MPAPKRTLLAGWIDPAEAFNAVCGSDTDVVWLDSGPDARAGRSYVGRARRFVTSHQVPSMLEFLRSELAETGMTPAPKMRESGASEAGFEGGFELGWVGWLGYETRFETMGVRRPVLDPSVGAPPDSAFLYLDEVLEFDHENRTATILSLSGESTLADALQITKQASARAADAAGPAQRASARARWRDTDHEYLAMIRECQARIAAGDAYQLCLTTEVSVDAHPDPVATYLALRQANPSHHGALIRIGDTSLLSSSPEQFLSVSPSGAVRTRPIKGTRPRGTTPASDARLADELLASEKERAENLMIVDLMRNDIGRVSRVGSVEVPSLLTVESYASVHQLVSTITGQLADGLEAIDAVVACFPAGSMTGTPKSSATRILERLERHPRGVYAGAFGYFGLDGRIDLAMVIRSIVLSPSGASIGTGGGITALSDPEEELAEVKLKAAALLAVLLE